jgi:site-specific recombinase XerD
MNSTTGLHRNSTDWLLTSQLAPYIDAYTRHLTERRYASGTVGSYLACVAHFARWTTRCRLDIRRIDEDVVQRFLDDHLPRCNCACPVRKTHRDLRAALGHLLIVLRSNFVIAERLPGTTPVDQELRRFDDYLNHVRGLAPKTRSMFLHTARRLLFDQFGGRPVVISEIKPEDVRRFVACQSELYSTPASAGTLASALRGYFRFRATCGDQMHGLIGAVSYPASWQLASLPKALSSAEVERLQGSLGHNGPSARRAEAVVRCALDLGLRSNEIANLGLDDIDWRAGTVTLRRTKSRREDVLPLPEVTGRAIAEYLKFERPQTTNRSVFVRHVAPRDQPIGPDLVRKMIRQAYARAGLPYTRAHLLRHTIASRLLDGGSSLKEVADVLRHRSLNTTLIYTKLDSTNLAAVALPWPGSAA